MKIAIVSCINEFQSAYSIASMTRAKLKAITILSEKYPKLIDDFVYVKPESGEVPDFWKGEVRSFKEFIPLKDWAVQPIDGDFFEQMRSVTDSFIVALEGVSIAITDDFLLQGWYLPYLISIRIVEKLTGLKVYHNNHSCPTKRKELPPPRDELYRITTNEFILYNNNSDIVDEEKMYRAYGRVIPIFNPIEIPQFLGFPKAVESFYYKYNLFNKDVIMSYPCRLASGKQLDKWLTVVSALKYKGAKVFGIIVDSYGTGSWEVNYRKELHTLAESLGLKNGVDYVFVSESIEGCNVYTPYDYVRCISSISNLFVQTSISETYSLIMLEAMATKQFTILNEDLRYILTGEVGRYSDKAKFGSLLYKTSYRPSFKQYCNDLATFVINTFSNTSIIKNFVWCNINNNLIRYGMRLLTVIGYFNENKEAYNKILKEVEDVVESVILDGYSEDIGNVVEQKSGVVMVNPMEV